MSLFHASLIQALSDNGNPISGALWKFYLTGTTTPTAVYADFDFGTSLGAVVTADADGRFVPIYFNDAVTYRAVLCEANGTPIEPYDVDPANDGEADITGADIDFEQPGANADASDLQAKGRQTVTVLDYIPKSLHAAIRAGTDITNHTPYLQAMDTDGLDFFYFPAGGYNIDTAYVPSHDQVWQGEGTAGTSITSGVNGYIAETALSSRRISCRDIAFIGDTGLANSGGFKLFDPSLYGFYRCSFTGFNREAIRLVQAVQVSIEDCAITNCGRAVSGTVTITNATPAVVTFTGHGLTAGTPVVFTTTGALPVGIVAARVYYVSATDLAANTFKISATAGGALVNTTTAGSGTHTAKGLPYAGIYIDPGATASVQVSIRGGYISSCGIGVKSSIHRSGSIRGTTFESNVLGGKLDATDGLVDARYGEANTVDFDMTDSGLIEFRHGTGLIFQHYVGGAFNFRAIKNGRSGFIECYSAADQVAGGAGTWIDAVLGTQDNLYQFLLANNAVTTEYQGTMSADYSVLFRATTANIRTGAARLVHTPTNAIATVTIATPGVMTLASHGFVANTAVLLSTDGALPTGLTAGTTYYVRNPATDTFELSATSGGASIATSGTQSGTHYVGEMTEVAGSYSARSVSASLSEPVAGKGKFALPAMGKVKLQISVDNVDLTVSSAGISGTAAPTNATCARLHVEHTGTQT